MLYSLAMARIKKTSSWSNATNEWIRIHDIINLSATIMKNIMRKIGRETIRKQAIHHFRDSRFH